MTTHTELIALRKLATDWRDYKLNNMSSTAEHIGMLFTYKRNFQNAFTPDAVIELLDALEARDRRIAVLERESEMRRIALLEEMQGTKTLRAELDALRGQADCSSTGVCVRSGLSAPVAPAQPAQDVNAGLVETFDAAVIKELPRVSHVQYDSYEICKFFAENLRTALVNAKPPQEKKES